MVSDRWKEVCQIFEEVVALPAAQREEALERRCRDDPSLRNEVESLLHNDSDHFMLTEGHLREIGVPAKVLAEGWKTTGLPPPREIGPYRVGGVLGEGGMGVVYRAEQGEPIKRRVALKVIKHGRDTEEVLRRFEIERQALALMDHPNIARVYDAGSTEDGRLFFTMEYVAGVSLTEYCDRQQLDLRERLELFRQVCQGIHHAHQKGIIHRDIKPSNILVTTINAVPSPKIIDFGVAKATSHRLTEKALFTEHGLLVGTPEYMSPEQVERTAHDVDTRTDVYSLGVVLYELLVGELPFDSVELRQAGFWEIQRTIREVMPPKPSTKLNSVGASTTNVAKGRRTDLSILRRQVSGDLDWIVLKCLEKDRTRRYDSASEIAADLERYLRHEPVLAGPPSTAYRLKKFTRRNRTAVTTALLIVVALLTGLALASYGLIEANKQEAIARAALEAEANLNEELELFLDFQEEQVSGIDVALMAAYLRRALPERAKASWKRTIRSEARVNENSEALDGLLIGVDFTHLARSVLEESVFKPTLANVNEKLHGKLLIQATLLQNLSETTGELGLFELAYEAQRLALERRSWTLGRDNADTLTSISHMGVLLRAKGKLSEAMPYYLEALETRRRVLGDEHIDTLSSINNMGSLLKAQGRLTEAEQYHREALAARRRVLGDEHPDTLNSIGNMGALLRAQWKLDEAEPYYRQALAGMRRVLGDEHRDTLISINNMGSLLQAQGRLSEAKPYYLEALETRRRVLVDEHPDTLVSLNSLGLLFKHEGKYVEAEVCYREALETRRRVLGDQHPDTLRSINNMGSLLEAQGNLLEAMPYYRKALESRRQILTEQHPVTLVSISSMGALLRNLGERQQAVNLLYEAESLGAEAARLGQEVCGPRHPRTGLFLAQHGLTLLSLERYPDAASQLEEAYSVFCATRSGVADHRQSVLRHLVSCYEAWHEAEPDSGHDRRAEHWRVKQEAESAIQSNKRK